MKYETPKLSRLGDLRELTKGGYGSSFDGGFGRKNSSPPNDS